MLSALWLLSLIPIYYIVNFVYKDYSGKEFSIMPTFLPPRDINLLEAGFFLDNKITYKTLLAAIVELAHLGYLEIDNSIEGNDSTILRAKDGVYLNRLSQEQQLLFRALFFYSNVFLLSPYNNNSTVLKTILSNLNRDLDKSFVKRGYFTRSINKVKLGVLSTLAMFFMPILYFIYSSTGELLVVFAPFIFFIISYYFYRNIFILGSLFFGAILFFQNLLLMLAIENKFFLYVAILISFSYIGFKLSKVNSLTDSGSQIFSRLLGLKEFISRVEKDKIEALQAEDSEYVDTIIPYALLFGYAEDFIDLAYDLGLDIDLDTSISRDFSSSFDTILKMITIFEDAVV